MINVKKTDAASSSVFGSFLRKKMVKFKLFEG
jgi:hypothetical protein